MRIYSSHTRWFLFLVFFFIFFAFDTSRKSTFYSREGTLSHQKFETTEAHHLSGIVVRPATEPRRNLQSVLTSPFISLGFHSGPSWKKRTQVADKKTRGSLAPPSRSYLSSLLSHSLISKLKSLVGSKSAHSHVDDNKSILTGPSLGLEQSSKNFPSSSPVNFPKNATAALSTDDQLRSVVTSANHSSSVHRLTSPSYLSPAVVASTNHSLSTTHTTSPNADVASSTFLSHATALIVNAGITPICPETPPNLVGMLKVNKTHQDPKTLETKRSLDVFPGGFYKPSSCLSRHRVAIIIPFRDRAEHLNIFLNHMMPFLKKQQLEFAIYVVELAPKERFNRAMLMNIGYREALKDREWQCFVFHDVDLLPENDRNIYSCPSNPRHMSAAVDTMAYKLPYRTIFGGVSAFSKVHFELINGFSNMFFGWGGEDDDLYFRTVKKGLKIIRYPMKIARYTMLKHVKDKPNPERFKYLKEGTSRMADDGINKLSYKLIRTERRKLYTKVLVSIDEKAVKRSVPIRRRGRKA